jgi:hypothetical protein
MDLLERLRAVEPGKRRGEAVAELAGTSDASDVMKRVCRAIGARSSRLWFDDAVQDMYVALLSMSREELHQRDTMTDILWMIAGRAASRYCKNFKNSRWLGEHLVLNDRQERMRQTLDDAEQFPIPVDTLDAVLPSIVGEFAMPKMLWMGMFMQELRGGLVIREVPCKRYHRIPCNEHLVFQRTGEGIVVAKPALMGFFSRSAYWASLFGVGLFESNDKDRDPIPELILPFREPIHLSHGKELTLRPGKTEFSGQRLQAPYDDTFKFPGKAKSE